MIVSIHSAFAVNNQQYSRSSSVVFEMIEDGRLEKSHAYSDYEWLFNLGLSHVESPLAVKNSNNSLQTDTLIEDMLSFHLGASWYIKDYLQIGVQTYFAQFKESFSGDDFSGFGDLDLRLKLRVYNNEDSAFSIMPQVIVPTSQGAVDLVDSSGFSFGEDTVLSDEELGYGLNLIYERVFKKFQLALNVGMIFNDGAEFIDSNGFKQLDLTQRLKTGFGIYIPISAKAGVNIEYMKTWTKPLFNDDINPNELYLGSSFGLRKGLTGFAGFGLGNFFDSDDGNDYRFSFGVKYSPTNRQPASKTIVTRESKVFQLQNVVQSSVPPAKKYTCGAPKAFGDTNVAILFYRNNVYKIGPNQKMVLDRVSKIFINRENHIREVRIYGHTSSVASSDYNKILGRKRAKTVKDYIVSNGVNPDLLVEVESRGESDLASRGETEEDHKNNRRTEITVVFSDDYLEECRK